MRSTTRGSSGRTQPVRRRTRWFRHLVATQPGASLAADPDLTGPGLCSDQNTGGLAAGSSEDCLYLSIYQPENQAPGETFPVMLVRAR